MHDPCAVYFIINPDDFEVQFVNIEIENKSRYCDGRTIIDLTGASQRKPNAFVAKKMNLEKFWKNMMDSIEKCNKMSPINTKKW